ncbi:MAG TPA: ATP-binding protein [Nitrospiraceae bacterium]|nr:ATP-binding protein [Nitrospiraceae bacterium]
MDTRNPSAWPEAADPASHDLEEELRRLFARVKFLEGRVQKSERRRRALIHILSDLKESNRRLSEQRTAMLHLLSDHEQDRKRLASQAVRLDNSRRALLHMLQDLHVSNSRLERSRKAMIHIMGNLRDTTEDVQRREHELRDKQEQLVQAGKLATLGELTTGIAHELNNPLNNIGLFIGNVVDHLEANQIEPERILRDLRSAMQQVRKATAIISHLRTFGRAAPVSQEPVYLNDVIKQATSLIHEQLRLHQIDIQLNLDPSNPIVRGSPIQLEQVFINLLTNARDAIVDAPVKAIRIRSEVKHDAVEVTVQDSGPGIPAGLEQRIFDPFFSTKDVGAGTGLGLSITYGILKDHHGSISVASQPGEGARFTMQFPIEREALPKLRMLL